ncbi:hypothetical protein TrVE_jg969 [Triparma verrucosa]|uniref:Ammonium transporter AmtB-like domain-containing protein n=1 Tax=Triparma verrucosa TaxID=1606542 RepID=A0A9W7FIJ4_9STRA|nr:hypothetical protein TrVE_jg969 [Triparma verrucosa]
MNGRISLASAVLLSLLLCTFTGATSWGAAIVRPCSNPSGGQCGGISPDGGAWESEFSSCCPSQHVCSYKTMYYSECVRLKGGEEFLVEQGMEGMGSGSRRILDESLESISGALDGFFMLINAQIIFFMQGGFAMLEVGIIQTKNAKSILFKNMLDMFVVALCWFFWGFAIAGKGASGQIERDGENHGNFGFGEGLTGDDGVTRWGSIDWRNAAPFIHSLTFATTTTTIMSGGVAERMKVEVYIFLSAILSSVVYASMVAWCWSEDGFMAKQGFIDFAGSCVVHLVGGSAALIGSIMVGPRRHRFAKDGTIINFKSTSLVLSSLGAFILAFTWISFNGSSVLYTKDSSMELSAFAVLNTFLCLGSSGVMSVIIETVSHKGTYDLPYTINGMLGGLVAVTASCAFIDNWSAILLGILSALLSKGSSWLLLNKLHVDDPLDAFTVHGANGILGTLWVGLFGRKDLIERFGKSGEGLFMGAGDGSLLGAQVLGCLLAFFFTVVCYVAACILWFAMVKVVKALSPSSVIVVETVAGEDYDEVDEIEEDMTTVSSIDLESLSLRDRICLSLRVSRDAEIVGADFIYHEGNAFELTKNQVKMYNQEKNAQERIQKKRVDEERAREGIGGEGGSIDAGD